MSKLESYRDLEVWKISMQLAREVYQITEGMPKHEIYGLTSQIRRASVSVPANIAEAMDGIIARNTFSSLVLPMEVLKN